MIDSLAVPERSFADLHDEVLRRSARLRSARRRRFGLATTALASAVAAIVAMGGGPIGYHVSTPAGPAGEDPRVDTTVVATPSQPTAGGAVVVAPGAAPRLSVPVSGVPPVAPAFAPRTWVLVNDGGLSEVDGLDRTVRPVESPTGMEMRWSPDGASLVRVEDDDLWVADRRIFDGSDLDAATAPAWLPDNKTVVFVRRQGLVEPAYSLWALDVRTGTSTRVRNLDASVTPTVAPDGRIAYQCEASGHGRVCLTDRTGADLGIVPGSDWYGHLSWSPDGAWIAVTVGFGRQSSGVMLLRPDGSSRHAVLRDRVTRRPVWFADSTRLVVDLLPPDSLSPDNQPCTRAPCADDTGIWSVALDGSDARLVAEARLGALLDARPGA